MAKDFNLRPDSFDDTKFVHGCLAKCLARLQNTGREIGMIGGIGMVLRFQTECPVLIEPTASWLAVKEIASVKLDARLSCMDLHFASGLFAKYSCSQCRVSVL